MRYFSPLPLGFCAGALLLFGCASVPPAPRSSALQSNAPAASPQTPADGSFVLEGYVVDRSDCPPCPPAAQCEACEQSLIVSNQREPTDRRMTTEGNLRVLVTSVARFALGAKVKLKVRAIPEQPFQNDPCCSRLGPYIVQLIEALP